jgi:hypothetical protein
MGVNIPMLYVALNNGTLDRTLDYLSGQCGVNMIRIFGKPQHGGIPVTTALVDAAGSRGIKIIVSLCDAVIGCGQFGYFSNVFDPNNNWNPTGWYVDGWRTYIDPSPTNPYPGTFQDYARDMAQALSGKPGFYGIELLNEPTCLHNTDVVLCVNAYVSWAHNVAAAVHNIDPTIKVGIGQKSSNDTARGDAPNVGIPNRPPDFVYSNENPNLNITSGHYYDDVERGFVWNARFRALDELNGRFFYVGEFGIDLNDPPPPPPSITPMPSPTSPPQPPQGTPSPTSTPRPTNTPRPLPALCITSSGVRGIESAIGCIAVGDTNEFSLFVTQWGVGIGGGIALLLIIYAIILITTSAGDQHKLQAGKELLTAAVAGLLLMLFSVFILRLIGVDILKIPGLGNGTASPPPPALVCAQVSNVNSSQSCQQPNIPILNFTWSGVAGFTQYEFQYDASGNCTFIGGVIDCDFANATAVLVSDTNYTIYNVVNYTYTHFFRVRPAGCGDAFWSVPGATVPFTDPPCP